MRTLKQIGEDWSGAMSNAKYMWDITVDDFKNGNIGGTLANGAMATFTTIGSAIGGLTGAMPKYDDTDVSGLGKVSDNFVVRGIGKTLAKSQVSLENAEAVAHGGVGYEFDKNFNAKEKIDGSVLTEEDKKKYSTLEEKQAAYKDKANKEGAILGVKSAVVLGTSAAAGVGVAHLAPGIASIVSTEYGKAQLTMAAFKEGGVAAGLKSAALWAGGNAKTVFNVAKGPVVSLFKTPFKLFMKHPLANTARTALVGGLAMGAKAGTDYVSEKTGVTPDEFLKKVQDEGSKEAVEDVADKLVDAYTEENHPVISKGMKFFDGLINNCQALYTASKACLGQTAIGSVVFGSIEFAKDKVMSFIDGDKNDTVVLTVKDYIAKAKADAKSASNGRGFAAIYEDKLRELDAKDDINTDERILYRRKQAENLLPSDTNTNVSDVAYSAT